MPVSLQDGKVKSEISSPTSKQVQQHIPKVKTVATKTTKNMRLR